MTSSKPNPVDVHVGRRLRLRRTLLGMSQERLGELLGLTFQQIQKYERGANRIGSSRLYEIGQILDIPVSFFFDDMPDELRPGGAGPGGGAFGAAGAAAMPGLAEEQAGFEHEAPAADARYDEPPLDRRETLELVRAYYRIGDPAVRRRLFDLAKALANMDAPRPDGDDAGGGQTA